MLIYIDGSGNIITKSPDKIYQGSNYANTIYLVGSYPQGCTVNIAFKLPQAGVYTEPYLMVNAGIPTEQGLSAWMFDIPVKITEFCGKVEMQIRVYSGVTKTIYVNGVATTTEQLITSAYGSFDVEKGVPVDLSEVQAPSVYDQILTLIAQIQLTMNGSELIAMGILPWDYSFVYKYGTLIYKGGKFYKSLQNNNVDKNPETETLYWQVWEQDAITALADRVTTLEENQINFDVESGILDIRKGE